MIIASRRKKIDESLKDLQQAICTSVIADPEAIRKLFNSLPKKWKKAILLMLERAAEELPLLLDDIENLKLTLQKVK
jgi:vacuolar-type H+-ATPase subunit F/Vma7